MIPKFAFSLLALLGLGLGPGLAQQKPLIPVAEVVSGALSPLTLPHLTWVPGSDDVSFGEGSGIDRHLVRFSAGSGRKTALLSLADLEALLRPHNAGTLTEFPAMQWVAPQQFVAPVAGQLFKVGVENRTATPLLPLPATASAVQVHPGLLHTTFETTTGELFVAPNGQPATRLGENSKLHPLPSAGARPLLQAPDRWSPPGHLLAFVTTAGSQAPETTIMGVGVYDVRNGQTIRMAGQADWPYLAHLTWAPDGKSLFAVQLNRGQNQLRLNQYETPTGNLIKTVLEERVPGMVQPRQGPVFVPGKSQQFLWLSARDGFAHLYLYDTAGNQVRRLTAGAWEVTEVLGFDAKGQTAFFSSTEESPMERHYHGIRLASGQATRISQGTGMHQAELSPSGSFFLSTFSSFVVGKQIRILETGGKIRHTLLTDRNPLQDYRAGDVDLVPIKGPADSDLYTRLITPPDFDRGQQYPVVVYMHHARREQRVTNSWLGGGELWMQWLAQQGFLVFELDGRGSANRGRDFGQAPLGQDLDLARQDQLAGVAYLQSLPYVDPNRIGVLGLGTGGYLAADLLVQAPAAFKTGIAVAPTPQWHPYIPFFPVAPLAPTPPEATTTPARKLLVIQEARSFGNNQAPLLPKVVTDRLQVETVTTESPGQDLNEAIDQELLLQIHRFLANTL